MAKKEKNYVTENPKSMMLVKSAFGQKKSFKLIPITNDCPFVECLFSPREKILVVISKFMKQSYHMVPKLDDNGDEIKTTSIDSETRSASYSEAIIGLNGLESPNGIDRLNTLLSTLTSTIKALDNAITTIEIDETSDSQERKRNERDH